MITFEKEQGHFPFKISWNLTDGGLENSYLTVCANGIHLAVFTGGSQASESTFCLIKTWHRSILHLLLLFTGNCVKDTRGQQTKIIYLSAPGVLQFIIQLLEQAADHSLKRTKQLCPH